MMVHLVIIASLALVFGRAGTEESFVEGRNLFDDGIARLVQAYPGFLLESARENVVVWKDGTEMVYDDCVKKSFDKMIEQPCLKDQMAMVYPLGWPVHPPGFECDPGRVRYEPFFRKLYGDSRQEVEKRLRVVRWFPGGQGRTLLFTGVNDAASALECVAAEISELPADVQRCVAKPVGTFNWRFVAGTNRLSMHAYGAAIDFEFPKSVRYYWRWAASGASLGVEYPVHVLDDAKLGQVVRIFENHGFIWGGKWRHFDTMHFEYRPELTGMRDVEAKLGGDGPR